MLRNKSAVLLALAALSCTLFGFVQTANAQVLFGSASGTVTDPSGAAVPKAHVSSISKATGTKRERMRTRMATTRLRIFLRACMTLL